MAAKTVANSITWYMDNERPLSLKGRLHYDPMIWRHETNRWFAPITILISEVRVQREIKLQLHCLWRSSHSCFHHQIIIIFKAISFCNIRTISFTSRPSHYYSIPDHFIILITFIIFIILIIFIIPSPSIAFLLISRLCSLYFQFVAFSYPLPLIPYTNLLYRAVLDPYFSICA